MKSKVIVIETETGRQFKLLKTKMIESNHRLNPYSALRKDVKDAVTGKIEDMPYLLLGILCSAYVDEHKDTIFIGCQSFSGKNYRLLKKWAKGAK